MIVAIIEIKNIKYCFLLFYLLMIFIALPSIMASAIFFLVEVNIL